MYNDNSKKIRLRIITRMIIIHVITIMEKQ